MAVFLFSSYVEGSRMLGEVFSSYGEEIEQGLWKIEGHYLYNIREESIIDFNVEKKIEEIHMLDDIKEKQGRGEVVVLSPHKSSSQKPAITTHCPGNWGKAEGGEERTLNIALASRMLYFLENLENSGIDIQTSYEADHHGPTTKYGIMFIEIGANKEMWNNKKYGEKIFESVIEAFKKKELKKEVYFGAGGNHYMGKQTKLAKKEGYAFGHLLPKYKIDEIEEDTFLQAIEKNYEGKAKLLIDKKGLNKEGKEKIIKLAEKLGVEYLLK